MKYDSVQLSMRCHLTCDHATLFIVRNTAQNDLFVVAMDVDCARWIARGARHIREVENGIAFKVREEWLAADDPFRSALRRAVSAGSPGAIVRVGNSAVITENRGAGITGEVYQPLSTSPF